MTKEQLIQNYNTQIGNVVPSIDKAIIDICSLMDVIDTTKEFDFKFSLFPSELFDQLRNITDATESTDATFTDTTYTQQLDQLEIYLSDKMRQIAFYPKQNVTFEKTMHVPILDLSSITASDEIKTVFQIPISVKYYIFFNNTLTTVSRNYNSNIYFDHTAYMLTPECILSQYNFNDLFEQTGGPTTPYPDSTIWNHGIDFTYMNNFHFTIDDPDIYAQRKNIVFFEISLTSSIKNFDFYVILKDGTDVYLRKGSISKLSYRKVFYNADYINIKNRIVKYSD